MAEPIDPAGPNSAAPICKRAKSCAPELYGIPIREIARICQVDLTTARRWKRGARCPPKSALLLILGDLGAFDPEWAGWTVKDGVLFSPERWEIPVNQARAMPVILNQLAGYQTEFRRMRAAEVAISTQVATKRAEIEQLRYLLKTEVISPGVAAAAMATAEEELQNLERARTADGRLLPPLEPPQQLLPAAVQS